ncbi:hypothetical protein FACS18947_5660 [Bacteroidia bacterium]|nr:hypothetical protein FACS18947_5660 [Bacteroidia bacterium]
MHIGLFTDGLAQYDLSGLLVACQELGIKGVELGSGNWSSAPHMMLEELLSDESSVCAFKEKFARSKVQIDALNCSGNVLDPTYGEEHRIVAEKTFQLAEKLGVQTVVMTSGLPAGGPHDKCPNWITTHWPPENYDMLDYQWNTIAIPIWKKLTNAARSHGVRVAFELHGASLVYNLQTFERLCEGVGNCKDILGINMDPSHSMWMGGDAREVVRAVPESIFHVHLKDVVPNKHKCMLNGVLDYKPGADQEARSWNFDIPGAGNGQEWWEDFVAALHEAKYDGILSIELEDYTGKPRESIARAIKNMQPLIK